ncbi:hypothetical protein WM34_30170 [Burkholderia ubonensis]|nr:hypothetical protein WJ64_22025 [Burkholderia ubonensis]KWD09781.1 hypothetical protein WL59_04120 [Burkholderia ubonensis]KWD13377.1 hypothetical protein WL60_18085 [Burkholderia ubonensis]KWF07511.1 hypothetical protein WL83_23695 [Burkholderia ubonensis]KWQ01170.1 hypothetical protein WM34_30170 [Burkholderia ubonensis]
MEKFNGGNGWDPIITTVDPQAAPAEFDAELIKYLDIAQEPMSDFRRSRPRFVIGVRNETGAIYRRYGMYSMGDVFSLNNWFQENGFVDEIGIKPVTIDGCDHIFSRAS